MAVSINTFKGQQLWQVQVWNNAIQRLFPLGAAAAFSEVRSGHGVDSLSNWLSHDRDRISQTKVAAAAIDVPTRRVHRTSLARIGVPDLAGELLRAWR